MFGSVSKKELKIIDNYFEQFVNFVKYEQNDFKYIESTGNRDIDAMFNRWNKLIKSTDKQIKDDIKVIGEIVLTTDKVEQGIFKCRIKSETSNPMVATLKKTVNKMLDSLDECMHSIQETLESYSSNDYTKQIDISPTLKARMLSVMKGVNALGEALATAAKTNLSNGQMLERNSNTMKSSMNNLAAKANEQAASLEQTAAAVEEITSITRNNADNANKMAELSTTVRGSVTNGRELASKTAGSMDEINEQVSSINEAITVIDQIAFQTNILSLNAAVEAATAGEAGKGFAVVAQEVRNLASRSAQAAKEIKDLVENATTKASEGKVISDDMIKGYEELNTHINETIHIIENVSAASKEQMTGIEQINDTITMLDRVTQENASEATQISNIASEVSTMAKELVNDAKSKQF
ncbi:MCP-domain signal transduction protein [Malaciobacter halophilus]|nr:methyl-accepting chemotaxis protein [Malaciobacter halophilus]AXH08904.1 MCP-domain signal transduction protein [Malaciobacter halophilus]